MHSKRKHTKTRTGCQTCRARRIKCDEERPRCRNCTRRELDCSYSSLLESSRTSTVPAATQQRLAISSGKEGGGGGGGGGRGGGRVAADRLGPERRLRDDDRGGVRAPQASYDLVPVYSSSSRWFPPPPAPGLLTTGLEMKNLELLHHFTTSTYLTMTTDNGIREVWRLVIPRIALEQEFLMHALLAMSALHLSFITPRDKSYAAVAEEHHRKALGPLQAAFSELESHGSALFAANSVTAMYVFACPPATETKLPNARAWIPLFRGIWATTVRCWERVSQGQLAPLLIRKETHQSRYGDEEIGFPDSLFKLSQRCAPDVPDPGELEDDLVLGIYRGTTDGLKHSWDLFLSTEPRASSAFQWPCTLSDEFVQYVEQRRPRALVLLAHYCVLVESLEDVYWWAKGRGMDEIERIEGVLDEKWKHWLEWPISRCMISKGPG